MWNHSGKGDPALSIEVDEILVRRCAHDASKHTNALWVFTAGQAPNQLVDDTVNRPVVVNGSPRIPCHRNRRAAQIEALVGEGPEMVPATNL